MMLLSWFLAGITFGTCAYIVMEFLSKKPRPERSNQDLVWDVIGAVMFGLFFGIVATALQSFGAFIE